MNTNTEEHLMNDHEIPVPEFGFDCTPDRVERLETIIARKNTELAAVRRVAQQQRLRADAAEAKLAERREADR